MLTVYICFETTIADWMQRLVALYSADIDLVVPEQLWEGKG